jgi:hypothetical protein
MTTISNYQKVVLYPESYQENELHNVEKSQCFTVQDFSYECCRNRNDAGFPYGNTLPSTLKFTVRLQSPDSGKLFYQQMKENALFYYTFFFNATYGDFNRLKSFEDAMVVKGYVVDIEEQYDCQVAADGKPNQMLISVTLLLGSVIYKGMERDKYLEVTRY